MEQQSGNYVLIRDVENNQLGKFDKRLPCCGCGIGWFSFLLGFVFPLMWYYATILYFGKYYHKDPRERGGLAANAVAGFNLYNNSADYSSCYSAIILVAAIRLCSYSLCITFLGEDCELMLSCTLIGRRGNKIGVTNGSSIGVTKGTPMLYIIQTVYHRTTF
ncbi:unnamed protein product [Camellia sinensis]